MIAALDPTAREAHLRLNGKPFQARMRSDRPGRGEARDSIPPGIRGAHGRERVSGQARIGGAVLIPGVVLSLLQALRPSPVSSQELEPGLEEVLAAVAVG